VKSRFSDWEERDCRHEAAFPLAVDAALHVRDSDDFGNCVESSFRMAARWAGEIHWSHSMSRRSELSQPSASILAVKVSGATCLRLSGPM